MRRFLCLSLVLSVAFSCGGERVAVDTPPAPQPGPPPASAPSPEPVKTATVSPGAPVVTAPRASGSVLDNPTRTEPRLVVEVETPAEVEEAIEVEEALRVADPEEPAETTQPAAIVEQIARLEAESDSGPIDAAQLEDPELPALDEESTALFDELAAEAVPEDYSIPEVRERRLLHTESDLPLTLNSQVARRVNYFGSGRGRGTIRATLGRAGAFREMIERILEEEDVPKELFHLAQAESGFRPKARSYARATGMWQFMSFRGKQYGLRQDRNLEERYDPESATRAAARHLKDLYIEFGDWYLAMAAYNCGPGRVTRAIARGKTRDYWELSNKRLLPRQTRDYVPIILAMAYVDKNLDMYDIGTIDFAPARKYDTVEIADEVSLELLADLAGTSATALEDLNPALARSATPPYRYDLRIPEGSADGLHEKLAAIPADKRLAWRSHEVREGDTIEAVAKRYQVPAAELVATNNLGSADASLQAGLRLNVPAQTKLRSFRSWGGAGGLQEAGTGRYRVAGGDTLGAIARRFNVSVAQLRSWNGLPNTFIRAGRYLVVRPDGGDASSGASTQASSSPGPAPSGRYRVRSGDTLGKIASRHGASVSSLMAWNGLSSTRISVGQTLKVPGADSTAASNSAPSTAGPGQYRIRSGDNLGAIATRFGVSVSDLKAWNGLRSTRIRAGNYLRVRPPSASSSGTTAAAGAASGARYKVRRGDSLAVIARRNGVTVADLQRWNGLSSTTIQAGQSLIVGGQGSAPAQPTQTARASAPPPQSPPLDVAKPSAPTPADGRYRIRSGDTLGHIAEKFGVTASDLRRWNNMRGSRISAGQYLVVRPGGAVASATRAAAPSDSGQRYRIRSGDTLELIAKRFNCSISELKAWNGLRSSRIRAGSYLTVKPGNSDGGAE